MARQTATQRINVIQFPNMQRNQFPNMQRNIIYINIGGKLTARHLKNRNNGLTKAEYSGKSENRKVVSSKKAFTLLLRAQYRLM